MIAERNILGNIRINLTKTENELINKRMDKKN